MSLVPDISGQGGEVLLSRRDNLSQFTEGDALGCCYHPLTWWRPDASSCLCIWHHACLMCPIRAHWRVRHQEPPPGKGPRGKSLDPLPETEIPLRDWQALGVGGAGLSEAVSVQTRISDRAAHIHTTSWSRCRQEAGELPRGIQLCQI